MSEQGPHPLVGRQRRMILALRVSLALAATLALGGLLLPGETGRALAWGFVGLVIAAPVVRTGWLALRWWRRGDPRFALVAVGVLGVVALAAVLSW